MFPEHAATDPRAGKRRPENRHDQACSRTHGLDAGGAHVGKNDLDVGTEDQVNESGNETEGNHVSVASDGSSGC